jgi:hypothetical protein
MTYRRKALFALVAVLAVAQILFCAEKSARPSADSFDGKGSAV